MTEDEIDIIKTLEKKVEDYDNEATAIVLQLAELRKSNNAVVVKAYVPFYAAQINGMLLAASMYCKELVEVLKKAEED